MNLAHAAEVLAGALLAALVTADMCMTVLHVDAESPLSSTFNRAVWSLARAAAWPLPARSRGRLLSWAVPLMVVGLVTFWALFYVTAFALLYLPFIHDPAAFAVEPHVRATALSDALYFSGVSFFTIGYGDISPLHPLARATSIFEGGSGLLAISMAVAYVLSVYPMITRQLALAVALNQETAGRSDGVVAAARYVAAARADALGARLDELNLELLHLAQAHGFYPVLYYVRPQEVHESFVRVLALIQGLVATLRFGLDPRRHRDIAADPRLAILEEGLLYTLHALGASSHLAEPPAANDEARVRADFRAQLEQLARRGLAAAEPGGDAEAAFVRFRASTDPYIAAYARNIGYDPESIRAVYGRWSRGSALDAAPSGEGREGAAPPDDGAARRGAVAGRAPPAALAPRGANAASPARPLQTAFRSPSLPRSRSAACAAARRAMGTRKGEHET